MTYGFGTWSLRVDDEDLLDEQDWRWMCGITVNNNSKIVKLEERFAIEGAANWLKKVDDLDDLVTS